ncbi:MAG: hypothetical protein PHW36_00730 [Bacilli bacterium]|nr:hypothetical protein [Bacilli bacterium]
MTPNMTEFKMNLTLNQQKFLSKKINGNTPRKIRDKMIVRIGNSLKSSKVKSRGVFVDLPNGNRGMILVKVLDFNIKTGNPIPDNIVQSSYVVDLPEMEMAVSEAES